MSLTFTQASTFVMPFGKHRGKSLDQIASTDEGLRYLDWLRGESGEQDQRPAARHIRAYLDDVSIQRELDLAVQRRGRDHG